ncbi:MAG: helix-turn-helix domain-containing protein [Mesorhizobium sp.]|nr:helix-turn-helix domain-containing protein [Mesorhizobium sp.]
MNEQTHIPPVLAADDQKRQRILEGAKKMVLSYGYQRTTMDDIARAADMSRPALYLLFRNKTDIYRAIAQSYFDAALAEARGALAADGPLEARLVALFEDSVLAMLADFAKSPHGAEILDMKFSLASDLVADWLAAMTGELETAIASEAERLGIDLAARGFTARGLAELYWDAVEGMKARLQEPDDIRAAMRALSALVARAVS